MPGRARAALLLAVTAACGPAPVTEDCHFTSTITSISCRVVASGDPFQGDNWFVDLAGAATARPASGTQGEVFLRTADGSILSGTITCPGWVVGGEEECLAPANDSAPASTSWSADIEVAHQSSNPRTYTVTATVDKVGSTVCTNKQVATMTVTCPP